MQDLINNITHGDCLEVMKNIHDKSIDMVCCDLPYGTTACKWDTIIPFEPLWEQYKRIIKDNGAIVLTASQPFTTKLINSNFQMFKYELIWDKNVGGAFVLSKKRILPSHENILIFGLKQTKYNPQMTIKSIKNIRPRKNIYKDNQKIIKMASGFIIHSSCYKEDESYPTSILKYPKQMKECNNLNRIHPTQKPVALFEYLIKTYTNEGDLVLDNCSGSGTTAIACLGTNRKYICIEKDEIYYKKSLERVEEYNKQLKLF